MTAAVLASLLELPPYQAYSYSYPHKTAYRSVTEPQSLRDAWAHEDRNALFLYLHIPFCSYRCGFCNLFTLARPSADSVVRYLNQIDHQLAATADALGTHRFVRFALGGGTPSYLSADQLRRLFYSVHRHCAIDLLTMPAGMEVSPETVDAEVRTLVRPQQRDEVERAIAAIREQAFPTLNLDLIYGIQGQTVASFLASIHSALAFSPEELYLYPLYVRPLTGLGRIESRDGKTRFALQPEPADDRLAMYRAGRDALLAAGYRQVSMRMFRAPHAPDTDLGPAYCCQNDGMVGIGCGARSYTRALHYSSEFGVSRRSVAEILEHYLTLSPDDFGRIDYGIALDEDEQRRRYVIQSLLARPGLDVDAYRLRFGGDCFAHLPQLHALETLALARREGPLLTLTDDGMARADTIGPWLISTDVAARMAEFELR